MDLEKDVPGLCSETCPASSHEGNGGIRIKTEAVSDMEQEEDPVPMLLPGIKAECEVSCMSVCPLLGNFHTSP
jgi:ferredoxin